jgi:copper resistance protein B
MMRATPVLFVALTACVSAGAAWASGAHSKDDPHGEPMLFWGAGAEVDGSDVGWLDSGAGTLATWDAYAWYGGDEVKLRLEAEGEALSGDVASSELRGLVSWNVSDFWDVQAGLRYDFAPDVRAWAVIGVQGLAPYFFETEARLFVSENAEVAFRFEQTYELLLTQQLILEPHIELNAYAQDIAELGVGAGLADIEAGLQMRYEITRQFAPYIDLVYERDVGETALITRAAGEDVENTTLRLGLRIRL